jgi:hypothetical protein
MSIINISINNTKYIAIKEDQCAILLYDIMKIEELIAENEKLIDDNNTLQNKYDTQCSLSKIREYDLIEKNNMAKNNNRILTDDKIELQTENEKLKSRIKNLEKMYVTSIAKHEFLKS